MPPKQQASKKTEQKRKEKVIEDKTFGLKNKKGTKNQKFVAQVTNQIRNNNTRMDLVKEQEAKKKKEKDELLDLNDLLKPVQQKVGKDVDPKSMLCVFFKQGMCTKGNKCKFSHDLEVERKTAKKNVYVDIREAKNDDLSEEQLREMVEKKGTSNRPTCNIICKHFIQAVEDAKYGWFWECPNNGDKCVYKHCLPEGYILKKDRKKMEDQKKEDEISLEELIEKERTALSSKNLTKINLQSFVAWKKKKLRERKEKDEADKREKEKKIRMGKAMGMSGRDLFVFNADMIADDDDADDGQYEKEEGDENAPVEKIFEIDANFFKFEGMDYEDEDEAPPTSENASNGATAVTKGVASMAINEDLFDVDEMDGLESDEES